MDTILLPTYFPVACHTDHIGPGSTFVAIKGMQEDGARYIPQAIEKGATTLVLQFGTFLSKDISELIYTRNIKLRYVPNTRKTLAELSAQALGYPARALKIIGITGTKGKSTTAFLTEHMLKTAGYKTALLSTVKNRIGDQELPHNLTTPQPDYLHVFFDICVKQGVQYVIMETAAQAVTLQRLVGIEFDVLLFTNFSLEHSEFYATVDDYFKAKERLFDALKPAGHALFNADDERVYALSRHIKKSTTFGLHNGSIQAQSNPQAVFALTATIKTPQEQYEIHAPTLLGTFNVYNCLAMATIAYVLSIPSHLVQQALLSFTKTPGRLERYMLDNGSIACIDYAHNPASFDAILSTLRSLTDNLIVVFGAGGDRDYLKRPLMGASAVRFANTVILTSDNPRSEDPAAIIRQIQQGIAPEDMSKVHIELDRETAIKKAYALSSKGSIIALLGKGPDEYQLIQGKKYPFSEAAILRSFQKHEIIN
jgi:UDP-N-acetylmuramoyl-L-alanyl-D-glutamate--2,6-diaminopimelate ligase